MLVFHWNISHFHVPILHRYIWMVYVYISFLLSLTFKHHDDHENIMDFLRRCRILSHFQSLQVRDWPDRGLREENSPILRKLRQEIQQPRREFSLLCFALLCFAKVGAMLAQWVVLLPRGSQVQSRAQGTICVEFHTCSPCAGFLWGSPISQKVDRWIVYAKLSLGVNVYA